MKESSNRFNCQNQIWTNTENLQAVIIEAEWKIANSQSSEIRLLLSKLIPKNIFNHVRNRKMSDLQKTRIKATNFFTFTPPKAKSFNAKFIQKAINLDLKTQISNVKYRNEYLKVKAYIAAFPGLVSSDHTGLTSCSGTRIRSPRWRRLPHIHVSKSLSLSLSRLQKNSCIPRSKEIKIEKHFVLKGRQGEIKGGSFLIKGVIDF